ncbi:BTAD domain-containing putative transcriptional regulator [Nonomuraea thailandensis]
MALWQGPPLTDVAGRWLPDVVLPGLEEERLAALERRAALDLRQGRHQEVAAELAPLVGEDPLRERLVTLLMTALSRGGHRTEALSVFRTVRRRFADELGLEPGEELQRLHQAILAGRDETAANGKTPRRTAGPPRGASPCPATSRPTPSRSPPARTSWPPWTG